MLSTVCPRRSYLYHIVSYYIEWVTTSWTYSNLIYPAPLFLKPLHGISILAKPYLTHMVLISDFNSEYNAQALRKMGLFRHKNLIFSCSRSNQMIKWHQMFHHMCAHISELPSNLSNMIYYRDLTP